MGMNGEDARFEALTGTDFTQVRIFQKPVLIKFVFDISQRELGAPHRHVEFGKNPGQSANMVSWPWVRMIPRTRWRFSMRYEMSGTTMSTPSNSASGTSSPHRSR